MLTSLQAPDLLPRQQAEAIKQGALHGRSQDTHAHGVRSQSHTRNCLRRNCAPEHTSRLDCTCAHVRARI